MLNDKILILNYIKYRTIIYIIYLTLLLLTFELNSLDLLHLIHFTQRTRPINSQPFINATGVIYMVTSQYFDNLLVL